MIATTPVEKYPVTTYLPNLEPDAYQVQLEVIKDAHVVTGDNLFQWELVLIHEGDKNHLCRTPHFFRTKKAALADAQTSLHYLGLKLIPRDPS